LPAGIFKLFPNLEFLKLSAKKTISTKIKTDEILGYRQQPKHNHLNCCGKENYFFDHNALDFIYMVNGGKHG
jgi:hypothetical protein